MDSAADVQTAHPDKALPPSADRATPPPSPANGGTPSTMSSTWSLPEPMLATPTPDPVLHPDHAAEPKWDGYRALLGRWPGDRVLIRSRRGGNLTAAFPEIVAAASQLPDDTALDGELVVWEGDRLSFERLQQRAHRRAATAVRAVEQWPAHFVAFDLLRAGADLTAQPYRARRAALEQLFADHRLQAPWTLCPSTTDPKQATDWLEWSTVGLEGLVFKRWTSGTCPGSGRGANTGPGIRPRP